VTKVDGNPALADRFVGLANKQLAIERAYLLMDSYIAEMSACETKAALAEIKAAILAKATQPLFAKAAILDQRSVWGHRRK